MSTNRPIAEHVSNIARLRRWRLANASVLLLSLFLPWITTSCDSHVSKAGYEVLTQYYIVFDYPVAFLSLALPAYALANMLMALRVPFQRRIWLTVPMVLAICTGAVGVYDLAIILSPPSLRPPGFLTMIVWLMALPLYVAAYALIVPRIRPRRKAWLRAPFAIYVGLFVVGAYFLPGSPIDLSVKDFTPLLAWCTVFVAANIFIALEVPLQRRSWLLVPLALCVCGAVGGIASTYVLDTRLEFGAYVFLLGLLSAVLLELYDAKAVRRESSELQLGTAAPASVQ